MNTQGRQGLTSAWLELTLSSLWSLEEDDPVLRELYTKNSEGGENGVHLTCKPCFEAENENMYQNDFGTSVLENTTFKEAKLSEGSVCQQNTIYSCKFSRWKHMKK